MTVLNSLQNSVITCRTTLACGQKRNVKTSQYDEKERRGGRGREKTYSVALAHGSSERSELGLVSLQLRGDPALDIGESRLDVMHQDLQNRSHTRYQRAYLGILDHSP
jgi:hypothetical protein